MTPRSVRQSITIVALLIGAGVLSPSVDTQTMGQPERLTAFAVSLGGQVTPSGAQTVDITIKRWSTDKERQQLVEALQKGPGTLLDTLRDLREVGTIRTPDSVGYPLHYAHQRTLPEGGRRVVIATDRPIGFWEAVNRPRTIDYPFTLVELNLDREGTGEGRMSLATKIIAHDNIVELENYEAQPVMLKQVKSEPLK
jgi:hypothetical protein